VSAEAVKLVRTCTACPEQYDAYIGERKVGYLRLRGGAFTVQCPDCDLFGPYVYAAATIGHGEFAESEREHHLTAAKDAIAKWAAENPEAP
jgi:hypothetical protein